MKPRAGESLLLGLFLANHTTGERHRKDPYTGQEMACALGLIDLSIGYDAETAYPWIQRIKLRCPGCLNGLWIVRELIMHLNDSVHHWPPQKIAEWLESIDPTLKEEFHDRRDVGRTGEILSESGRVLQST